MKTLLRPFIATLLALALFVLPADAHHKDHDYAALAGHAGCHAALTTSDEHSVLESFYEEDEHRLYIGTKLDEVPEQYALIVALHEIGHCLQAQEGLFSQGIPPMYLELDADRRAADAACQMGLDGRALLRGIFIWALETYGYAGDYGHGTLEQRISQGRLALSCEAPQTPFWAAGQ